MGHCKATIYIPKDEDFGISPVQSLAARKPVIGVKEGGLVETVLDPADGILIPTLPTAERIRHAVRALERQNGPLSSSAAPRLHFGRAFVGRLMDILG